MSDIVYCNTVQYHNAYGNERSAVPMECDVERGDML